MHDDWLIWQLADSAFPAGSFAHSGGLEAAWQQGLVSDAATLGDFIRMALTQSGRGAAPFAVAACAEPDSFHALDRSLDLMLTNHVTNRASRAQGRSLLSTSVRIFDLPALAELETRVRLERPPTHLAPVFGFVAGMLGLCSSQTGRLFVFTGLRGLLSGAVRLGITGPIEAQRMQVSLTSAAQQAADLALKMRPEAARQTAPLHDLFQGMHDRLYSRLFQS